MLEQISNNFKSHVTDETQTRNLNEIRNKCRDLAYDIERTVPSSREQSIALTKLEEVMFWANAGIARE